MCVLFCPQTVEDYGRTLVAFEAVVGNPRLGAIESADVRRFRDRLLVVGRYWCRGGEVDLAEVPEEERLSHRTVVKAIKNLSTFLVWAVKEEVIPRNPAAAVDLPTVARNHTNHRRPNSPMRSVPSLSRQRTPSASWSGRCYPTSLATPARA